MAQFCKDALKEITRIYAANRIPLLVGGTMLYFHALQQGLSDLPPADTAVRARLAAEKKAHSLAALYQRLTHIDPVAAARIKPTDPQRILRALEVYEISGRNMTEWFEKNPARSLPYQLLNFVVAPAERAILHERIATRFDTMLAQGLVHEVERLLRRGDLSADLPSMRAVNYRQVFAYLTGKLTYDEMRDKAMIATRQLAKRQLTWWKRNKEIRWITAR